MHGLVAIAFVAIGRTDEIRLPHAHTIELVDLASVDTPAPPSSAATGGGAAGASSPTAAPAITTPRPIVTQPARAPAPEHMPAHASGDVASILGPASSDRNDDSEITSDSISLGGQGSGRGGSDGGSGTGRGIGSGPAIGTHAQRVDVPPPPPAPAKISKARPPRLIFPTRSRDVDAADDSSKPFVASVLVDEHGDVAGARLIELRHTPADGVAASLVFRFRYEPALDDDGHPIRARIDQPFLVE